MAMKHWAHRFGSSATGLDDPIINPEAHQRFMVGFLYLTIAVTQFDLLGRIDGALQRALLGAEMEERIQMRALLTDDPTHKMVLYVRKALECSGRALADVGCQRGDDIERLAHALPYLWSGGRDVLDRSASEIEYEICQVIVAKYGMALPEDRREAVNVILQVAGYLMDPKPGRLLATLITRYPLVD